MDIEGVEGGSIDLGGLCDEWLSDGGGGCNGWVDSSW